MMKILTNKITLILFLSLLGNLMFSQGLRELITNQVLVSKYKELKSRSLLKTPSISDTLTVGALGILDEFSYDGPYPDTALWLDNYVYINRGFGIAPPTIGVATFDGLDYTGMPYDWTALPTSSALADNLTSKPIDLRFLPSDSVYFSFFYQPQGNGNAPETNDSLVLQFKSPGDTNAFQNVWAHEGEPVSVDSSWTLVMIPITDTTYLKKGFQFRFKNYATLSANADHWNIDYVYLNKLRSKVDTSFSDVSYVYNGTPLLKNYTEMPWEQYRKSELRDSIYNQLRYDKAGLTGLITTHYGHEITDDFAPSVLSTYSSGSGGFNLLTYETTHTYTACDVPAGCLSTVAIDTSVFPVILSAPALYTVKQYISTGGGNLNPQNDTLRMHQRFFQSYAYDDGTAENSFYLSDINDELAEKFVVNSPDSLQFIDIFFNPFISNASLYTFNLKVWSDISGHPGTSAIYASSSALSPAYGGVTYNQFIRYKLDAPLYLTPGTYYFGFEQNTDQQLNVGIDENTNTSYNIFYYISGSGTWFTAAAGGFSGSLMLHPVFGKYWEFTDVNDIAKKTTTLSVFPNPATDELFIRSADGMLSDKTTYSVMDLLGRTIIETTLYTHSIDISSLKDGIYFIRIKEGTEITTQKFIKAK